MLYLLYVVNINMLTLKVILILFTQGSVVLMGNLNNLQRLLLVKLMIYTWQNI